MEYQSNKNKDSNRNESTSLFFSEQMTLGEASKREETTASGTQNAPLAYRMRPRTLEEFQGHLGILSATSSLRRWIEADRVPSMVLWGNPGCGKTTLAEIIARHTRCRFRKLSAVQAGIKDIKEEAESASLVRRQRSERTILFVDEIHRFNQTQQDALLPHVESGLLTLIGATTENPSYQLRSALLSRLRVVRLHPLTPEDVVKILVRAVQDPERGLGGSIRLQDDVLQALAQRADGDARRALTELDTLSLTLASVVHAEPWGWKEIQEKFPELVVRSIKYDDRGDEHYQVISAFIKSVRDSDPNAALYYLARMLEGGEDPVFIARRLVILSSEDIGLADNQALPLAIACKEAVEFLGMPEARIPLAQCTVYLSETRKSNRSYAAINLALEEGRNTGALPVPLHLRNAVTKLDKGQGYGVGYQYAHGFPESKVTQEHFPPGVANRKFLKP